MEYIKEISDYLIPWYFIGYSQAGTPFIQAADITGIYGISFLVVLTNYSFSMILLHSRYRRLKYILPVILLCGTFLIYGISAGNRDYSLNSGSKPVRITGIQGNTGSIDRWDRSLSHLTYQNYIELSRKNFTGNGILIWPETVLNSSDRVNFEIIQTVNTFTDKNSIFITGGTRKDKNGGTFNSVFVSSKGLLSYIYDKQILFPYSEKKIAGLSHGGVMGSPDTFVPGKKSPLFRSNIASPALSICFESLYPSFIRSGVKGGADILINVANDSWFGNTYEPYMHFNSTIVRAIENRRAMARITNSGISALIAPSGKVIQNLALNESGVVTGELTVRNELTFYTRYGDLMVLAAAFIAAAAIAMYLMKPDDQ